MNKYEIAIQKLGGDLTKINMHKYNQSLEGLDQFLKDLGIKFTNAKELCTPNHPDKALKAGFENFLPPKEWWLRVGVICLAFDQIRLHVGQPIKIRNMWRPPAYNAVVGGADGSDHVDSHAIDMDFRSSEDRKKAEKFIKENYYNKDKEIFECSIGLGNKTIHIGFLSENGRRKWKYGDYTE